jgi:hypothetical protein
MKRMIAVLLLPILGNAEPGPVTRYLINEPASLLDVGMMRLETLTTEFENRVGLHFRAEINASYAPADDRIYVSFLAMSSDATEAQMAEGCRDAMSQMNIWLLKSLPGLFLHVGHDDPSLSADFYQNIRNMFELRCYFSSAQDSSEGRFWASRTLGTLGDSEMTIGKWPMRN